MTISINADSIEELKYLAGIINSSNVSSTTSSEPESSVGSCEAPVAAPINDDSIGSLLSKMREIEGIGGAKVVGIRDMAEEEQIEEWANSTDHFDGEARELEQPKGAVVDTSLRRYLGAKGNHVTVDESSHTVESIKESYKKFLKK